MPTSDVRPAPIVIARLNADASPSRFKADVMALVRSIEQQYWALAQAHVRLGLPTRRSALAEEVLKTEQAELKFSRARPRRRRSRPAARAVQSRTRDPDIGRHHRPSANCETSSGYHRPTTAASSRSPRRLEAGLEPVWDTCVDEMLEQSPEIVQRKTAVQESSGMRSRSQSAIVRSSPVTAPSGPATGRTSRKDDPENRSGSPNKRRSSSRPSVNRFTHWRGSS